MILTILTTIFLFILLDLISWINTLKKENKELKEQLNDIEVNEIGIEDKESRKEGDLYQDYIKQDKVSFACWERGDQGYQIKDFR